MLITEVESFASFTINSYFYQHPELPLRVVEEGYSCSGNYTTHLIRQILFN